jgi:hypothetical protein
MSATCSLYYKCFTILIITIVNYTSVWSITYDHNLVSLSCDRDFIVPATAIRIVNYSHKTFIVQPTPVRSGFTRKH